MEERDRWGDEESVTKTTYRKRNKSIMMDKLMLVVS